jgi:Cu(I)/Ag(I) efflux system membrane fusion protein/cobalt-zinc-cadmium efflux system membrane fusion protein
MAHIRTTLSTVVLTVLVAIPVMAQGPAATQKPTVDIMLTSKPSPPKMGDNTLEVMLKDAGGKPITDADVSVTFFMAAMPAMKMPEMKNTVALKHVKDGTYSGIGKVMMAGNWDVTVTAKRAGKEIGAKKFPVIAK